MKSIIMAGGSGTRLWPLSTLESPKQFLTIKNQKFSLFQTAVQRSLLFCSLADVYVLTVESYREIVMKQIEELTGTSGLAKVIIEPIPKNTLPAIYNAVKYIRDTAGDDIVVVSPSDHLIKNPDVLAKRIHDGQGLAKDYIFTFGINPAHPDTGFGYIKAGDNLEVGSKIEKFCEKPNKKKAEEYVKDGYLWNSGLFMFNTAVFHEEMQKHAPEVFAAFEAETSEEAFTRTPAISIDYGIMEKSSKTAVLPLNIEWNDLGTFESFHKTFASLKDIDNNILLGLGATMNAKGNLIYSDTSRPCVAVGVEDIIIVDSENGLLVCKKGYTQLVKEATKKIGNK